MSTVDSTLRSSRLRKFFTTIVHGRRAIKVENDAKLFLDSICDQEDRPGCVETLNASKDGLQALKMALRINITPAFINETSSELLNYLDDEGIQQLCGGQLLRDILAVVVDPPMFWKAMVESQKAHALSANALKAFARLILYLLSSTKYSNSTPIDVWDVAEHIVRDLLTSPDGETRQVAYKIEDVIRTKAGGGSHDSTIKPGGRHDNDFEDYRKIAIFPTTDEFLAKEQPYYLQVEAVLATEPEKRAGAHLDNQFRLYREDMLAELRNDLQIARGNRQGKRMSLRLTGLVFHGVDCGDTSRRRPASIALRCYQGLPRKSHLSIEGRKKFFADNKNILKHNSFGCLLHANEIVAFATVDRNEALLAEEIPIILLQVFGDAAIQKALVTLKATHQDNLQFVQVDTPFFAYEPILRRLQEKVSLPLSDQLLGLVESQTPATSPLAPLDLIAKLRGYAGKNLRLLLKLKKNLALDQSQIDSLIAGLQQVLSLIQGPPGTGKSLVGALQAKALYDETKETILVLCYTNHALDQFLEDLIDIGIPEHAMLRLGSKSTDKTKSLSLYEQSSAYKRSQETWNLLNKYSNKADDLADQIRRHADEFRHLKPSHSDLLDYLQFSDSDFDFYLALSVPTTPSNDDGMTKVGRGRRDKVDSFYLVRRWIQGGDAGIFHKTVGQKYGSIWSMDRAARNARRELWERDFFQERAVILQDIMRDFNENYEQLTDVREQKNAEIIRSKRIIGCTTTAAAKYSKELLNAKPGIVLVEEAGEIHEPHILTALSPSTKHMILIGDHQQLRPKINNYALSIEKGDGYDLNRSVFERLVVSGYPHTTLGKQHRMRPEISALVKQLMYPNLEDGPKTMDRESIRGLQSNVIFFNHSVLEREADKKISERRDEGSKISRENSFEAEMILKTVRYLAQQGYGSEKQVVLTPYLGQLKLLLDYLKTDHDPVLNDLDSFDLVKAGLLPAGSAGGKKSKLRISTIDNYQGEESDIVIASLTRSNAQGDIGFMAAPQRLNVLLSRARNGLIIFGNAATFKTSRKGTKIWTPFFEQLAQAGQLFDGLPVKCERHPTKLALLKSKEEFDRECPDGGCSEPCRATLNCGKHTCAQKCHQLSDHSKVQCMATMQDVCPKGHKLIWRCWKQAIQCHDCEVADRKLKAQQDRDHKLDVARRNKQQAYALELAQVDDEIAHERRLQKEARDERAREKLLEQRKKDLENEKVTTRTVLTGSAIKPGDVAQAPSVNGTSTNSPQVPRAGKSTSETTQRLENDSAQLEWDFQKLHENAHNKHLDALMEMIGLEEVKLQILGIKTKIDTSIRQGTDLQIERFGVSLLGNPGTGKTTVARLYAKFLASVGVLPGNTFKETTGARLASDGVPTCKKLIEDILNDGGGAIFIDEAYQLVSGNSFGGGGVLDFLLAEVENLTGKIVFILAGYTKPMEKFFAHNEGLPGRFPHTFTFKDYEDEELLKILAFQITKSFQGRMKVMDGLEGLYCRIAARRVGYARGREGFGNARAVENALTKVRTRQSLRLRSERRAGNQPDDFLLTAEDLIGPDPSTALEGNKTWEKLKTMIGLKSVKDSIEGLLQSITFNYERELAEEPLLQFNLNRVFLGSPGTGKTTVAKLYGQILADIGLLSNGEVIVKNPSDFVGDVLGASEKTTKGILTSTVGKVLVIDEAYGLHSGGKGGTGGSSDPYKEAVIDTIVAEVQSVPGDDRCVLLLGYRDQMEAMFQGTNPGLSRRFPLSEAFEFEDFSEPELDLIFQMKLKQQGYSITDQGRKVAMEALQRARNKPNFGNAGEVDILLNGAKSRHQQRRNDGKQKKSSMLEAVDIDPDFKRSETSITNVRKLFQGVVGCEELVAQFEGYQRIVTNLKARGMDPREEIAFNFLFRGPPGTGKTTTARKVGKIYYDMGFLATAEVLEISATDLVGEYIGQTGPKTQKMLEKGLGKVLLIDEAYRLAEGHFAKEAMDEIVDCLTKPAFAQKLIVILAGYDADINRLMAINPGLTSRFPETVTFKSLAPNDCFALFLALLKRRKHLRVDVLENAGEQFKADILGRFATLATLANWANARDVGTLAKSVFGKTIKTADPNSKDPMELGRDTILEALDGMISERSNRAHNTGAQTIFGNPSGIPTAPPQSNERRPPPSTSTDSKIGFENKEDTRGTDEPISKKPRVNDSRDPGVSDEIWRRLQEDVKAAAAREEAYQLLLAQEAALQAEQEAQRQEEADVESQIQNSPSDNPDGVENSHIKQATDEDDAEKRRLEQERIQRVLAMRKREEELDRLARERKKLEEERKKDAEAQRKLRVMGVCPVGFRWIKQSDGYRCAGGSHWVSNAQLEIA